MRNCITEIARVAEPDISPKPTDRTDKQNNIGKVRLVDKAPVVVNREGIRIDSPKMFHKVPVVVVRI